MKVCRLSKLLIITTRAAQKYRNRDPFEKQHNRKIPYAIPADYIRFEIENYYVYEFGTDYKQGHDNN
jgi:hypoxanthine-guanine phosphoribosyltransferase